MNPEPITVAVEGITDIAVVERLFRAADLTLGVVHITAGKGKLDARIGGYNQAARFASWFVLRDFDHDAECPPELLARLLPSRSANMRCRFAVRATEAWLLADREAISEFLDLRPELVPSDVEALRDPKRTLVELARRSPAKSLRADMLPRPGTTARVGSRYSARVIEFATELWRPEEGARRCASLRRCLDALRSWR